MLLDLFDLVDTVQANETRRTTAEIVFEDDDILTRLNLSTTDKYLL